MVKQRVFGFAGWSGSGKTTLIEQIILRLRMQNLSVALIKHAHHEFDIDHTGKDSFRHREAGATQVLISSAKRWALMTEHADTREELTLEAALAKLMPVDLVLIEGFKRAAIAKLEVYRSSIEKPLMFDQDTNIIGVCHDNEHPLTACQLPQFSLQAYDEMTTFIMHHVGLPQR